MNPQGPVAAEARAIGPSISRRDALTVLASAAVLPQGLVHELAGPSSSRPNSTAAPLHYSSLTYVASLIEEREISPVELTAQMLERIAAVDPGLHSYVTVLGDAAMARARRAEAEIGAGRYRCPLHALPIGVKVLCYPRAARTMPRTPVLPAILPAFHHTS